GGAPAAGLLGWLWSCLVEGRVRAPPQPIGPARDVAGGVVLEVRAGAGGILDDGRQALLRVRELEPRPELVGEACRYAAVVVVDGRDVCEPVGEGPRQVRVVVRRPVRPH